MRDGETPFVRLSCPSGWAAARLLLALAREDAFDVALRGLANRLRRFGEDYPRAVHAFISSTIRFEREEGEVFQAPMVTITTGVGDCDCHARLAYALLTLGGVPARLAFLHRGGNPLHVVAQAWDGRAWRWLETTVKGARYAEHPIEAARRVGVIRSDVGGKMREVFMGREVIEAGKAYAMRVGIMDNGAHALEAMTAALAGAGFRLDEIVDRPPQGAPPPAVEPVANAKATKWARATATTTIKTRDLSLPFYGAGIVIDDVWSLSGA